MTDRLLAHGGCTSGTCPTMWINEGTGDVRIRGFDPAHPNDPAYERDIVIPRAQWDLMQQQLLSQLQRA